MSVFRFREFCVYQERSAMKVGTDAMLLGALVEAQTPARILDIGSGTGVIALMLAQRFPSAQIEGVELDEPSYLEACKNFEASPWSERLSARNINFLDYNTERNFDCIVSNPPYYQSTLENADRRKSQARHESALPMEAMLEKVKNLLSNEGDFWVIVPRELYPEWVQAAETVQLHQHTLIRIKGKSNGAEKRVIIGFNKLKMLELQESEMSIRDQTGAYTNQYIELTKAFHNRSLK